MQIKTIDEDQRIIEGVATTPSTDLMDDVVDPMGGEYNVPMPFLMDHGVNGSDDSVGHVIYAKPTKAGISVRIKVLKSPVLPHLDKAWEKLKLKLVNGLSIGFKPLEWEPIEKGYGFRYKKWRWLELSGVVVAANPDCSITAIKSFDLERRAAFGQKSLPVVRLDSPAGVSAQQAKPGEGKLMDVSKQIEAFEAKRMAAASRMEAVMAKAAEEGRTLDETESEDYKNAKAEVKSIDEHLVNLHDLESIQAAKAKAVPPTKTTEEGTRARDPREVRHITVDENLPKGVEFARYVKCLAAARGNRWEALEMAKANYPQHPRISTVLKAAVAAGTTTDATWAGPFVEYNTLVGEFIEFLRPQTIIGKFGTGGVPSLRNVPFNVRMQAQTSGGAGYWVGEGAAKPLTSFDFTAITLGFSKVANIAVLTDELIRFSNPSVDLIVRQSLADALRERLDIDFIDPAKAAVAGVSPASITNGITPITSSGTDIEAVHTDVEAVLGAFIAANHTPSSGVWIMSATTALALSMMRGPLGAPEFPGITMTGGTFVGMPVITSEYVPSDTSGAALILVNASDIFLADDGQVVIDASREASLEMLDNPTNNSTTGTPTTMVSMFQTNSTALKAERFINWRRRRDSAVVWVDDVLYTSANASP